MENCLNLLRKPETNAVANVNLTNAVAHCWPLESAGWNFRCVKCEAGVIKAGMGATWHAHNEYQIQIVADGVFQFIEANRREYMIRPGELVVIPWKSAHSWVCVEPGILMGISMELVPSVESIRSGGWLFEKMRFRGGQQFKPLIDDLLQSSIEPAHPSFRSKITAGRLYLLLTAILGEFLPLAPSAEPGSDQRGSEIVSRVIRYVNENFDREITQEQIAREFQLSSRQLHRLFMKHIGRSLHDYLQETRLEMAFKRLSDRGNQMQIKEIAFACGFNSLAYFSKCFRQMYGVPPSNVNVNEISLKPGFTVQSLNGPDEVPGAAEKRKPR